MSGVIPLTAQNLHADLSESLQGEVPQDMWDAMHHATELNYRHHQQFLERAVDLRLKEFRRTPVDTLANTLETTIGRRFEVISAELQESCENKVGGFDLPPVKSQIQDACEIDAQEVAGFSVAMGKYGIEEHYPYQRQGVRPELLNDLVVSKELFVYHRVAALQIKQLQYAQVRFRHVAAPCIKRKN